HRAEDPVEEQEPVPRRVEARREDVLASSIRARLLAPDDDRREQLAELTLVALPARVLDPPEDRVVGLRRCLALHVAQLVEEGIDRLLRAGVLETQRPLDVAVGLRSHETL